MCNLDQLVPKEGLYKVILFELPDASACKLIDEIKLPL
jgi:hypothetical protein